LHAAPRHAKRGRPAARFGIPAAAITALAGAAAAFVVLQGGSAAPRVADAALTPPDARVAASLSQLSTAMHREVAVLEFRTAKRASAAAKRKHLAAAAAARRARQAAQHPAPRPTTAPVQGGGDAASSALGVCIRDAEEGGSYVWGPGNGGGAYQFLLSTWERYGGAASEYGVASAAYQDQIFNNAIAAGGASNWTDYDGC
jgi:hypothetical protein